MKPVVFHEQSRTELDEAMTYYEQQNSGLGLELQAEVERVLAGIQRNPGLGSPYKQTAFRFQVLRRLPLRDLLRGPGGCDLGDGSGARKAPARLLAKTPTQLTSFVPL